MTPLDYFTARWAEAGIALPIYTMSNVNVDLNAMPALWAGVIVQAQELRNMTLGSQPWQEEAGLFLVGVFNRAGAGFPATDDTARSVRAAYMNWESADTRMRVEGVAGPLDLDPAAEEGWHRLALELRYQLWTQG